MKTFETWFKEENLSSCLEDLKEAGISTPEELFELTEKDLSEILGWKLLIRRRVINMIAKMNGLTKPEPSLLEVAVMKPIALKSPKSQVSKRSSINSRSSSIFVEMRLSECDSGGEASTPEKKPSDDKSLFQNRLSKDESSVDYKRSNQEKGSSYSSYITSGSTNDKQKSKSIDEHCDSIDLDKNKFPMRTSSKRCFGRTITKLFEHTLVPSPTDINTIFSDIANKQQKWVYGPGETVCFPPEEQRLTISKGTSDVIKVSVFDNLRLTGKLMPDKKVVSSQKKSTKKKKALNRFPRKKVSKGFSKNFFEDDDACEEYIGNQEHFGKRSSSLLASSQSAAQVRSSSSRKPPLARASSARNLAGSSPDAAQMRTSSPRTSPVRSSSLRSLAFCKSTPVLSPNKKKSRGSQKKSQRIEYSRKKPSQKVVKKHGGIKDTINSWREWDKNTSLTHNIREPGSSAKRKQKVSRKGSKGADMSRKTPLENFDMVDILEEEEDYSFDELNTSRPDIHGWITTDACDHKPTRKIVTSKKVTSIKLPNYRSSSYTGPNWKSRSRLNSPEQIDGKDQLEYISVDWPDQYGTEGKFRSDESPCTDEDVSISSLERIPPMTNNAAVSRKFGRPSVHRSVGAKQRRWNDYDDLDEDADSSRRGTPAGRFIRSGSDRSRRRYCLS